MLVIHSYSILKRNNNLGQQVFTGHQFFLSQTLQTGVRPDSLFPCRQRLCVDVDDVYFIGMWPHPVPASWLMAAGADQVVLGRRSVIDSCAASPGSSTSCSDCCRGLFSRSCQTLATTCWGCASRLCQWSGCTWQRVFAFLHPETYLRAILNASTGLPPITYGWIGRWSRSD